MITPDRTAAKDEFLSETQEMLEQMEKLLGALTRNSPHGDPPQEAVNSFFRLVHSLKGLSDMLGFHRLAALAHGLESLLDELRLGRLKFSAELSSLLEICLETFFELIETTGESKVQEADISTLLGQIEHFVDTNREVEAIDLGRHLELPEAIHGSLTEYEENRLIQNIRREKDLFIVKAAFDFATFDVDLEELTGRLQKVGEVITTLPSSDESGEDRLLFDVLVASNLGVERVREATEEQATVVPLPRRSVPAESFAAEESGRPVAPDQPATPQSTRLELQSVRVSLDKLESSLTTIGELLIVKSQLDHLTEAFREEYGRSALTENLAKSSRQLEKSVLAVQDRIVQMRMVSVRSLFSRLSRLAHKLSREEGREVELITSGENTELDKMVIDEMTDPLVHLVRNAIGHGIESPDDRVAQGKPATGRIEITARHQGRRIVIEVSDDGRGIAPGEIREKAWDLGLLTPGEEIEEDDLIRFLFTPGFSTQEKVTELSGRGLGMDIVRKKVVKLGGAIQCHSEPGKGTCWSIVLPVTLVIIPSLLVRVANQVYAVPMGSITRAYDLAAGETPGGIYDEGIEYEGSTLPLFRLDQVFGLEEISEPPPILLVAHGGDRRVAFLAHEIRGRAEIVVKPLGDYLAAMRGFAGATELGDGKPVLVLDIGTLVTEVTSRPLEFR